MSSGAQRRPAAPPPMANQAYQPYKLPASASEQSMVPTRIISASEEAAIQAATLDYVQYTSQVIYSTRQERHQGPGTTSSAAVARMNAPDSALHQWHMAHLNVYMSACAALDIPPFPVTTRKVLLRLLGCPSVLSFDIPRVRRLLESLPPAYRKLDLRLPPSPFEFKTTVLGSAIKAFRFIHLKVNAAYGTAGKELSRSEWDALITELQWIRSNGPAAPFFPHGCSLEMAQSVPYLRLEAGDLALQARATSHFLHFLQTSLLPETASSFKAILKRHQTFLQDINVPLYPITISKISLDLVRRVNLPASVELYNAARGNGDPFGGFWSQKDVVSTIMVLCLAAARTAMLWPRTPQPLPDDPVLQAIIRAAPVVDLPEQAPPASPQPPQRPSSAPEPVAAPRHRRQAPERPQQQHQQDIVVHASEPPPAPAAAVDEEIDFEEAYRALFSRNDSDIPAPPPSVRPTTSLSQPGRGPMPPVLPPLASSPPIIRHTAPPASLGSFDKVAPPPTIPNPQGSLFSLGVLPNRSAWPLSSAPTKRPSVDGRLEEAKRQRVEQERKNSRAILEFCTAFVGAFGGGGEPARGGTMADALEELKEVARGVEWLSVK